LAPSRIEWWPPLISSPCAALGMKMQARKVRGNDWEDDSDESDEEEGSSEDADQRPRYLLSLIVVGVLGSLLLSSLLRPARHNGAQDSPIIFGDHCSGDGRPRGASENMHVHILMMAMDEVPHLDIWHEFFSSGTPGSFSAWLHCKDAAKCKEKLESTSFPADFKLVPSVYNAWCTDLVSPMIQMLRSALEESISPADMDSKFVFVSQETLPLKPLSVVVAELGKHPDASDFCMFPVKNFWFPLKGDNRTLKPTASQWSVLSKMDAQTLVDRFPKPTASDPIQVPMVENTSWEDFKVNHCIDEGAIFSTIFGLYHSDRPRNFYPGIGELHAPEVFVQGCCRTLGVVHGKLSPAVDAVFLKLWSEHTEFVKVMNNLRLEPGNDVRRPATNCGENNDHCEVIWEVQSVNDAGLRLLRSSSFLFSRKFVSNASLPNYGSIMFA